jgi:phenylacetate-CoA ligase
MARIKGGVLGRCDDMLIVRGVNLYPGMLDNLIREVPGVVEYQVEICRVMGLDDLLIKLETGDDRTSDDVLTAVANAFRTHLNIRVSVEHAVRGSLPRYEFKSRRYKRIVEP